MLSPSISAFASCDPANSRSSTPVVVLVKPNRVGSLHWRTKLLKKLSRALPFLSNWRKDCEYSFLRGSLMGLPLLFMPETTPRSPVWLSVTISTSLSGFSFSCSFSFSLSIAYWILKVVTNVDDLFVYTCSRLYSHFHEGCFIWSIFSPI